MPFCNKCGEAYKEGEQFCPKCGAKTGAKTETAAPAPKTEAKKVTKIGVSTILAWIFGVIFLVAGLGAAIQNLIGGLLIIAGACLILPPANNVLREKMNIELSGLLRFIIFIVFLAIGMSMTGLQNGDSDVVVQPTPTVSGETTPATEPTTVETQPDEPAAEPPKQKVKSATITIDRVTSSLANLGDIRITITNTGDVSITPKFDVTVTDTSGTAVCEDSPWGSFGSVGAGEKKTDEISILGCMFDEDGDYAVKVDLLDKDFNKLDSGEKSLTVDYWSW